MLKNYNELSNESDMLKGNIARMCVTDDMTELESMYISAKLRLAMIHQYNLSRLEEIKQCYKCDCWESNNRTEKMFGDKWGSCKYDHIVKDGKCEACSLFNKKEVL